MSEANEILAKELKALLAWAVFEPTNYSTCDRIRRQANEFLMGRWRKREFVGDTPQEAYYVRCEPQDIENGRIFVKLGIWRIRSLDFEINRIVLAPEA